LGSVIGYLAASERRPYPRRDVLTIP
jgi:hypothetical protein